MKISAIIPAYNEEKNIKNAIMSLKNQDFPKDEFEVIVVNDGSADRTKQIAENHAHRVITQKNQGPAVAKNNGVKKAKGEIIVFMDADTTVSSNYFKEIMKAVRKKGVIGGKPIIKMKSQKRSLKAAYSLFVNFLDLFYKKTKLKEIVLQTTCCFYKKSHFLEEGGFRKFTFDDYDMSLRMKKKGEFCMLRNATAYTSDRKHTAFLKTSGLIKSLVIFAKIIEWTKEFQRTGEEPEELVRLRYFERR